MNRESVSSRRPQPAGTAATRPAVKAREAGLELIGRINRWLIAGAVAAAGLLSLLAANAFHGRTVTTAGASSSSSASQSNSSSSGISSSSNNSGSGLQAPAQAPAPAPVAPAPVVSGGS